MKLFMWLCFFAPISLLSQKTIEANRINEKMTIDGRLNEPAWSKAEKVADFVQLRPIPGVKPKKETEVQILYDDKALYVSAICYDNPDSISRVLSTRDDYNPNIDLFGIFLDTYNDEQNGSTTVKTCSTGARAMTP